MHTLHEFYVVTKGNEYLIAVAFLLIFPILWRFFATKKQSRDHATKGAA